MSLIFGIGGGGGGGTWGSITGTLSNQTDLQAALDAKVSTTLTNGKFLVGNGSNVATAVTPSGDVTFDNTGAFAIGSGKVTNAMLNGSIAASKLVGSDIATVGTVTSGTWSATVIANSKGGTGGDSSGSTGIAHVSSGAWSYSAVNLAGSDVTGILPSGNVGPAGSTTHVQYNLSGALAGSANFTFSGTNLITFGSGTTAGAQEPVFQFKPGNMSSGGEWSYIEWNDGTSTRTRRLGINVKQGGDNGVLGFSINSKLLFRANPNYYGFNVAINDQTSLQAESGARVGGVYYVDNGSHATGANTTETTLATKTLPANFFFNLEDAIEIECFGICAANANTKQIQLYFGSTNVIANTTALALNGKTFWIRAYITDTDATNNQKVLVMMGSDDTTLLPFTATYTAQTQTVTSSIVVKVTGTNGTANANDITLKGFRISYMPGRND